MRIKTKKLIKDMCAMIIIFTQIFSTNILSYAAEEESLNLNPTEYIDEIIQVESDYSSWQDCTVEFSKELYGATSEEKAYIFNVLNEENESDGYIIVNSDNKLLEYSKNMNPYETALGNSLSDADCGYLNGIYEISQDDDVYTIDVMGEKITYDTIESAPGISTNGYVSGTISPQLQNSNNCIVTAISNLIWYYGKNGYSSLISGKTFSSVKSSVDTIMVNLGGYKNAYIPSTLKSYMSGRYKSATNVSSPAFSVLKSEIDNDYPCLLGFAAGSSYSSTVGHMTLCVGYVKISSDYYSCVVDGHSSSTVTKVWTKYNDFICKVRVQ